MIVISTYHLHPAHISDGSTLTLMRVAAGVYYFLNFEQV